MVRVSQTMLPPWRLGSIVFYIIAGVYPASLPATMLLVSVVVGVEALL